MNAIQDVASLRGEGTCLLMLQDVGQLVITSVQLGLGPGGRQSVSQASSKQI